MRPPEAAQPPAKSADKPRVTADAQLKTRVEVEEGVRLARATRPATSLTRSVQRSPQRFGVTSSDRTQPVRQGFDPSRATQAGLLNLAWKWQESGSPIRAIHAYMELLCRYPDSAGADAAVADLVALSNKLAEQGQFHTALAIYDQLEELLS